MPPKSAAKRPAPTTTPAENQDEKRVKAVAAAVVEPEPEPEIENNEENTTEIETTIDANNNIAETESNETDNEIIPCPYESALDKGIYHWTDLDKFTICVSDRLLKNGKGGPYADVMINPVFENKQIMFNGTQRMNSTFILPLCDVPSGLDDGSNPNAKYKKTVDYDQYSARLVFGRNEDCDTFTNNWINYVDKAIKGKAMPNMLKAGFAPPNRTFKSPLYIPRGESTYNDDGIETFGEEDLEKNRAMIVKLMKFDADEERKTKASQTTFVDILGQSYNFDQLTKYSFSGYPIISLSSIRSAPVAIVTRVFLKSFLITDIKEKPIFESRTIQIANSIAAANPAYASRFKNRTQNLIGSGTTPAKKTTNNNHDGNDNPFHTA